MFILLNINKKYLIYCTYLHENKREKHTYDVI